MVCGRCGGLIATGLMGYAGPTCFCGSDTRITKAFTNEDSSRVPLELEIATRKRWHRELEERIGELLMERAMLKATQLELLAEVDRLRGELEDMNRIISEGIDTSTDGGMEFVKKSLANAGKGCK